MTSPARIGMDIGGTKTEAIALDELGRVEATVTKPTVSGPEGVLSTAEAAVAELAERTGRTGFASIGVGLPGQIDRRSGEVRNAYNMGIDSLAIGPELGRRTGIPVSIDNDVTAAAIGAAHLLELGGTVAYLNLGTGVASGIIVDGAPLRGKLGMAGEIGHLPIGRLGRPCPCGQSGCLETEASGSALKAYWPAGGEHPGRTLLAAAASGDRDARRCFELLVQGAASAIRLLGLSLDPDSLVIGGGLRLLGAPLRDGIRDELARWESESPFLAALELSRRFQLLPEGSPAAAVGAALAAG